MTGRRSVALRAVRAALQVRHDHGAHPDSPIRAIDAALSAGVDVWCQPLKGVDGVYVRGSPPRIVLSSLRPSGRQAYTCAHELGHHVYGHGDRLEDALHGPGQHYKSPEEHIANVFAAHLLMPRTAVVSAFETRGLSPDSSSPTQIFTIASWLGVGYSTLIHQLRTGLRVLDSMHAQSLLALTVEKVRRFVVERQHSGFHLVIVDEHWKTLPIDLAINDLVLLPQSFTAPVTLERLPSGSIANGHQLYRAIEAGTSFVIGPREELALRIASAEYSGRAIYRHMAEVRNA